MAVTSGVEQKLWEGETEDAFLHVEFSSLAQDVTVEVSGGKLISIDVYGRAADLVLGEGAKSITVSGVPLRESSVVLEYPVYRKGEVDEETNPLITNDEMADALAEHAISYLTMRNTYDIDHRGNPELEAGDIIGIQTMFTEEMDALVLVNQFSYNGAFRGSVKAKGIV